MVAFTQYSLLTPATYDINVHSSFVESWNGQEHAQVKGLAEHHDMITRLGISVQWSDYATLPMLMK